VNKLELYFSSARETLKTSAYYDKRISFFIVSYYIVEALNLSIKTIFPISDMMWQGMSRGFMLILIAIMIWTIRPVLQRSMVPFAVTELIFIILYCISFLLGNAEQKLLLSKAFDTLCICVPMAIYVYSISDKNTLYAFLLKGSYFLIPLLALVYFNHANQDAVYSMSVSYALALPTMVQINESIKRKKIYSILLACVGVVIVILYGARGPLLCLATMAIVKMWRCNTSPRKRITLILLALSASSLFVLYYKEIIQSINAFLFQHGIYSRTLYLLINNRLLQSSGRDVLFDYYWDLVMEKPLLGWGLVGGWIKAGSGPHNMLIEFFLAFGIVGGALISIVIIVIVARSLFMKRGILGDLLLIYAAINIVMFFVSGDFLSKPNLFILVALYFSVSNGVCLNKTMVESGENRG
jgi:O-antigen ligase